MIIYPWTGFPAFLRSTTCLATVTRNPSATDVLRRYSMLWVYLGVNQRMITFRIPQSAFEQEQKYILKQIMALVLAPSVHCCCLLREPRKLSLNKSARSLPCTSSGTSTCSTTKGEQSIILASSRWHIRSPSCSLQLIVPCTLFCLLTVVIPRQSSLAELLIDRISEERGLRRKRESRPILASTQELANSGEGRAEVSNVPEHVTGQHEVAPALQMLRGRDSVLRTALG